MSTVTIVESDGGRPVVVKSAPLPEADDLRAEGERLRRAAHPGVVEVLRSAPIGDRWELRTVHAGRPLSALDTPSVEHAAMLVAGVAATLADLHRLGIPHGRIDASHVVVGADGRPVLCGFGPGRPQATPAADVAALGELLTQLLLGDGPDEVALPDRRWPRHRPGGGADRRTLLTLADQACVEPATCRPSAQRLAADIAAAVPTAASSPRHRARGADRRAAAVGEDHRANLRGRARALAGVAGLGLVLGSITLVWGAPPAADPSPSAAPAPPSSAGDDVGIVSRRSAVAAADATIHRDGRAYRVGQPGDELLVDDWDCDGLDTPALWRPTTGEVFVFPEWAQPDAPLTVEPLLTVPDGLGLVSHSRRAECPTLEVALGDGGTVPVVEGGPR